MRPTVRIQRIDGGKPLPDAGWGFPNPDARYEVTQKITRPSLRHPIARWRWWRRHGRVRSFTHTLYNCKIMPDGSGGYAITALERDADLR